MLNIHEATSHTLAHYSSNANIYLSVPLSAKRPQACKPLHRND
jgi:hypothetical protein